MQDLGLDSLDVVEVSPDLESSSSRRQLMIAPQVVMAVEEEFAIEVRSLLSLRAGSSETDRPLTDS